MSSVFSDRSPLHQSKAKRVESGPTVAPATTGHAPWAAGMEALRETVRVATSKPMQRAVVNTALLASAAATLFCLAAVATGLFFQNFVPEHFVEIPVHLQYGLSPNPYGVLSLNRPPMIKMQQEYDVSVVVSMPRSRVNVERGNFMVSLLLLGSEASPKLEADARTFSNHHDQLGAHHVVFSSRRSALVPYIDPMVSVARRLILLLYHLLVPSSETCKMTVTLADGLDFSRSSSLPASAYVEIEAGQDIQIYSAALIMTAQLRGLRWLMFYYRLPTYMVFTLAFWACEVMFMSFAWAVWVVATSSNGPRSSRARRESRALGRNKIGDEGSKDESSDHPYSFPTYGRQPPLKYEPDVKAEYEEERGRRLVDMPAFGAEADDEDEPYGDESDSKRRYDSGLGTSYSERGSESTRRRRSRPTSGHDEGSQRR